MRSLAEMTEDELVAEKERLEAMPRQSSGGRTRNVTWALQAIRHEQDRRRRSTPYDDHGLREAT